MKWVDKGQFIEIPLREHFSFDECLTFLGRSDQELLHYESSKQLYKGLNVNNERLVMRICQKNNEVNVHFLLYPPTRKTKEEVVSFIYSWFDLNRDLAPFYEMAREDEVLHEVVKRHEGLRMIGIPDLFEALTWAIIGQQVNLKFAYTLKKRFIEEFGEKIIFQDKSYWLYPNEVTIANLNVQDLRNLQFTSKKAEYIIGIARLMTVGKLSKKQLTDIVDRNEVYKKLLSLQGVGPWTAEYVMMKCLLDPTAFPIADVGLQNAMKNQLGMEKKPSVIEIQAFSKNWKGYEAYATFYLWRSLYG